MNSDRPFTMPNWLLAIPFAYVVVQLVSTVYSYYYYQNVGIEPILFWAVVGLGFIASYYVTKYPLAISRGLFLANFYFVYYLATLYPSDEALRVFLQYRNIGLSGYVVLFLLLGILTIVVSAQSSHARVEATNSTVSSMPQQDTGDVWKSLFRTKNTKTEPLPPTHPMYGVSVLIPAVVTNMILTLFSYALAKLIYDISVLIGVQL